jgi:hypothetical protein
MAASHERSASHRNHSAHKFPLLQLPDDVLGVIAKMMGKRASLTCSRLRQARGSPGACLYVPCHQMPSLQPSTSLGPTTPYRSFLKAWHHAVTSLELGGRVVLGGPSCQAIAEALPNLRQLKCHEIDPACNFSRFPSRSHSAQLTALTTLYSTTAAHDLSATAALAPRLRSLTVCTHNLADVPLHGDGVWAPLVSLSGLRHLHVPLRAVHLAAFPEAMRHLTGLTHLGLNLFYNTHEALDHLQGTLQALVRALAAMPLLASISIVGFTMLVPFLAPALQSMTALRHLCLEERYWNDAGPAPSPTTSTAGCLPDISTMPLLESLAVAGKGVIVQDNIRQMCSTTHGALRALQLAHMDFNHLSAVCVALKRLTALASLMLQSDSLDDSMNMARVHHRTLRRTLLLLPQLQNVQIHGNLKGFTPWLASLHAPTCLKLSNVQGGLQESDLRALVHLTSLRTLFLVGDMGGSSCRSLCMEAVRRLP